MAKKFKTFEEFEKQRSADLDAMYGKLIEAYEVMMESDAISFIDFIGTVEAFKWRKLSEAESMAKYDSMAEILERIAKDFEGDGDEGED